MTSVVRLEESAVAPIFVDESGRRRRWLRRLTYAVGLAALLALLVLWLTQLSGALRPDPVAPCPPGASAGTAPAGGPGGEGCARR